MEPPARGQRGGLTQRGAAGVAEEVSVQLASSGVRLRLSSLGAAIVSCEAPDALGRWANVHLRRDLGGKDGARAAYVGVTVGRYANRIAGARFELDGHPVVVAANEGPNQLHGGPDGFDRRLWQLVEHVPTDDGGSVTLGLTSPAGDQGYPGSLQVLARYDVSGDRVRITYTATTDAATIVNLTNHAYWNLDGAATIDEHHLTLAADEVLPVGADGIPTGDLHPVDATAFDLRHPTRLADVLTRLPAGLDHCFAVRGTPGAVRLAAVLEAPRSGRWLAVRTDQPGLQVYMGGSLPSPFVPRAAVALEAQRFPDTPNRPELGSAVLRPGERYTSTTELQLGWGEPPPPTPAGGAT